MSESDWLASHEPKRAMLGARVRPALARVEGEVDEAREQGRGPSARGHDHEPWHHSEPCHHRERDRGRSPVYRRPGR